MKKKLIATIEINFLSESLNTFYKMHYMVKCKEKQRCLELLTKKVNEEPKVDLTGYCNFELEFDFKLTSKKRAYDIINYSPTIKMIEDSLVNLKLFQNDDNMNIIKHTINKPSKDKNLKECWTVIKIFGDKK